jgi:branched-chain amino acid aminotransferase
VIARRVGALYRRAPEAGVTLVTSPFRRVAADALSPSIKSLNYLNNVLARIDAVDRGADEALFLDHDGYVAEATADNVFIVSNGLVLTPPTTQTLRGITRDTIIELASGKGFTVAERALTLFDMWSAHEVFMCGTMAEVVPVGSVDGRRIGDGTAGAVTRALLAAYHDLVRSTGTPIPQDLPAAEGAVA